MIKIISCIVLFLYGTCCCMETVTAPCIEYNTPTLDINRKTCYSFNKESQQNIFQIFAFDVGQGNCILLKSSNQCCMIDCGVGTGFRCCESSSDAESVKDHIVKAIKDIVQRSLLDYVIITHPHEDHYNLYDKLIEHSLITLQTKNIFGGSADFWDRGSINIMGEVNYAYEYERLQLGAASIDFLQMMPVFNHSLINENQISSIVSVTVNNKTILFTGDSEGDAIDRLFQSNYLLDTDMYSTYLRHIEDTLNNKGYLYYDLFFEILNKSNHDIKNLMFDQYVSFIKNAGSNNNKKKSATDSVHQLIDYVLCCNLRDVMQQQKTIYQNEYLQLQKAYALKLKTIIDNATTRSQEKKKYFFEELNKFDKKNGEEKDSLLEEVFSITWKSILTEITTHKQQYTTDIKRSSEVLSLLDTDSVTTKSLSKNLAAVKSLLGDSLVCVPFISSNSAVSFKDCLAEKDRYKYTDEMYRLIELSGDNIKSFIIHAFCCGELNTKKILEGLFGDCYNKTNSMMNLLDTYEVSGDNIKNTIKQYFDKNKKRNNAKKIFLDSDLVFLPHHGTQTRGSQRILAYLANNGEKKNSRYYVVSSSPYGSDELPKTSTLEMTPASPTVKEHVFYSCNDYYTSDLLTHDKYTKMYNIHSFVSQRTMTTKPIFETHAMSSGVLVCSIMLDEKGLYISDGNEDLLP